MNSEELEQSLKTEFEIYLNSVLASIRGDVAEFQKNIESEIEKHRAGMDEAVRNFSERFEKLPELDGGFKETVIEHLRLARDEGAKITATAIAQAEELEKASTPVIDLNEIKDAINEISSKDSQSSILKALIQHAAKHTPRGAFFIIKNEHFVGWKVFGKEAGESETAIRDIHFPMSSDSILSAAVRSLATVEGSFGTYTEDTAFLDPLQFGQPDRMYAIPLVARGRGVAVLYCDYGHEGVMVNTDAIEMLVKVAGLTVELLASAKAVHSHTDDGHESAPSYDDADVFKSAAFNASRLMPEISEPAHEVEHEQAFEPEHALEPKPAHSFTPSAPENIPFEPEAPIGQTAVESRFEYLVPAFEPPTAGYDFKSEFDMAPEYVPEPSNPAFDSDASFESAELEITRPLDTPATEAPTFSPPLDEHELSQELNAFEPSGFQVNEVAEPPVSTPEMIFDHAPAPSAEIFGQPEVHSFESVPAFEPTAFAPPVFTEPPAIEPAPFEAPAVQFEPASIPMPSPAAVSTPVVETVPVKSIGGRLSDRHVDLPIEVADDERRLHNDARRFARLLVSEIKLYNEKRVQEGRDSHDLYERLREAIDRSRDMYDKRVQPPVASKFDYFHYELVNSLADGDETKLGASYKGATV